MTTKKKKSTAHCTFRNGQLFCAHCGCSKAVPLPMAIDQYTAELKKFTAQHEGCTPEWTEPVCDTALPLLDRVHWWLAYGDRGASSETMVHLLSPIQIRAGKDLTAPRDPSDFYRCHKLLECVPEWRERLPRMGELSPVWAALAANWGRLTALLEAQVRGEKNDMYEQMKQLGC